MSYAKHPETERWYEYDDRVVSKIAEEKVSSAGGAWSGCGRATWRGGVAGWAWCLLTKCAREIRVYVRAACACWCSRKI